MLLAIQLVKYIIFSSFSLIISVYNDHYHQDVSVCSNSLRSEERWFLLKHKKIEAKSCLRVEKLGKLISYI